MENKEKGETEHKPMYYYIHSGCMKWIYCLHDYGGEGNLISINLAHIHHTMTIVLWHKAQKREILKLLFIHLLSQTSSFLFHLLKRDRHRKVFFFFKTPTRRNKIPSKLD